MKYRTIIEKGIRIRWVGLNGWLYRPDRNKDAAWLWLEQWDQEKKPRKISWGSEWRGRSLTLAPDPNYAQELGIDGIREFPFPKNDATDTIYCPSCAASYSDRFEVRASKSKCSVCLGTGDRAIKADALVAAWVESITKNEDKVLAQVLSERLGAGIHRVDVRVLLKRIR